MFQHLWRFVWFSNVNYLSDLYLLSLESLAVKFKRSRHSILILKRHLLLPPRQIWRRLTCKCESRTQYRSFTSRSSFLHTKENMVHMRNSKLLMLPLLNCRQTSQVQFGDCKVIQQLAYKFPECCPHISIGRSGSTWRYSCGDPTHRSSGLH